MKSLRRILTKAAPSHDFASRVAALNPDPPNRTAARCTDREVKELIGRCPDQVVALKSEKAKSLARDLLAQQERRESARRAYDREDADYRTLVSRLEILTLHHVEAPQAQPRQDDVLLTLKVGSTHFAIERKAVDGYTVEPGFRLSFRKG